MAASAVLTGCGGPNLDELRQSKIPVWYLGTRFEGLDLTFADDQGTNRMLLVYGTCEPQSDGGCSPPLQIQSCTGSSTVSLFGARRLVERASAALRPLNAAARNAGKPDVLIDQGAPC